MTSSRLKAGLAIGGALVVLIGAGLAAAGAGLLPGAARPADPPDALAGIPPLDAAAPSRTETATFALG